MTHTSTLAAQAVVVEFEYFEGEAGGAREEGSHSFNSIGTERIVAEVKFSEVGLSLHHTIS